MSAAEADFLRRMFEHLGGEVSPTGIDDSGVSTGGDVPFDHLWAYLCRLRDGKLAYQRAYWEPEEALKEAGVS